VTTTEAGAVPSLTGDAVLGTQTGKSRAGLVTETRVSPHPGSQKKSHSDEAGLRLGQEGKSAGQDQRGMWPGTEELQRSSRDKMQRLSLNAAPEEKKTQQEECLRRGFSWLFTGA